MQRTLEETLKDIWPDSSSPITVSTTVTYVLLDSDAEEVEMYCTSDFRMKMSPRIRTAWFYDNSATSYGDGATANVNAADELQDKDTAAALTLNDMQTDDYVYLILDEPCVGFDVDVGNANGNASTMTVSYYNGSAFADASATDGTASGGATLAQDGAVTWSQPSDEAKTTINNHEGYVYRISVSAALDSSVTVLQAQALSRRTATPRKLGTYHRFMVDRSAVAGLELDRASGSGTLNLHYLKY